MIRSTREFQISYEDYIDFINNYFGKINIDGQNLEKKKNSSIIKNKNLRIELSYNKENMVSFFSYELKSDEKDEVEIYYLKKGIEKGLINLIKKETPFTTKKLTKNIFLTIFTILIIALTFNFVFSGWGVIEEGFQEIFTSPNAWTTLLFIKFIDLVEVIL